MSRSVVNVTSFESWVIGCSKSNELPSNQNEEANRQCHEQRNVQVDEVAFFEEVIGMLDKN